MERMLSQSRTAIAMRKRATRLKEQGLCRSCGKSPRADGKTLCSVCLLERSANERVKTLRKMAKRERGALPPFKDCCDICEQRLIMAQARLDHDHGTTKARGWLCNACNVGLGYFRDNPEVLISAATYIARSLKRQEIRECELKTRI